MNSIPINDSTLFVDTDCGSIDNNVLRKGKNNNNSKTRSRRETPPTCQNQNKNFDSIPNLSISSNQIFPSESDENGPVRPKKKPSLWVLHAGLWSKPDGYILQCGFNWKLCSSDDPAAKMQNKKSKARKHFKKTAQFLVFLIVQHMLWKKKFMKCVGGRNPHPPSFPHGRKKGGTRAE